MNFRAVFFVTCLSLSFISCGNDEEGNVDRQLDQDIREISYQLVNATVETRLEYTGGGVENLRKNVEYNGSSKDQIKRIVQDGKFVPVINDKTPSIRISPDGIMEYKSSDQRGDSGCKWRRLSTVTGRATHVVFDLDWSMSVEIQGDSCTDQLKEAFLAFQDEEIERLNLQVVKDVFDSTDTARANARKIEMRARLHGKVQ